MEGKDMARDRNMMDPAVLSSPGMLRRFMDQEEERKRAQQQVAASLNFQAEGRDDLLMPMQIAKETIAANPQWAPWDIEEVMEAARKASALQARAEIGGPNDPRIGSRGWSPYSGSQAQYPYVVADDVFARNPSMPEADRQKILEAARKASALQARAEVGAPSATYSAPAYAQQNAQSQPLPSDIATPRVSPFEEALAQYRVDGAIQSNDDLLTGTYGGNQYAIPRGDSMDAMQDLAASQGKRFGFIGTRDEMGNRTPDSEFLMFDAPAPDESLMGLLGPAGSTALQLQAQNPNTQVDMVIDESGKARGAQTSTVPMAQAQQQQDARAIENLMQNGMELKGATVNEDGGYTLRFESPKTGDVVTEDLRNVLKAKASEAQYGDEAAQAWLDLSGMFSTPDLADDEQIIDKLLRAHGIADVPAEGLDETTLANFMAEKRKSGEISPATIRDLTYWWKLYTKLKEQ